MATNIKILKSTLKLEDNDMRGGYNNSDFLKSNYNFRPQSTRSQPLSLQIVKQDKKVLIGQYPKLVTDGLSSKFLDYKMKFDDLKTSLQEFNKQIEKCNKTRQRMKHARYKIKLHMELREQLHELVNTTDRPLQEKYLLSVYEWYYYRKARVGSANTAVGTSRPTTGITGFTGLNSQFGFGTQSSIQNLMSRPNTTAIGTRGKLPSRPSASARSLKIKSSKQFRIPRPSVVMKGKMQEYNDGKRTQHAAHDAPEIRIKQYSRKQIFKEQKPKSPKIEEVISEKDEQALMPKHYIESFKMPIYDPTKKPVTKSKKKKKKKKKKKAKAKKPPLKVPIWLKTNKKTYTVKRSEMITGSNVFDGRSNYYSYQPSNDMREKVLEKYWIRRRNKQLALKREAEENIRYMYKWAYNKGRLLGESGRRNEAMVYTTLFGKRKLNFDRFKKRKGKVPSYKIRKSVPQLKQFKIQRKGNQVELQDLKPDEIIEQIPPSQTITDRSRRSKAPASPLSPMSPGSAQSPRVKLDEHEKSEESSDLSETDQEQITSYLQQCRPQTTKQKSRKGSLSHIFQIRPETTKNISRKRRNFFDKHNLFNLSEQEPKDLVEENNLFSPRNLINLEDKVGQRTIQQIRRKTRALIYGDNGLEDEGEQGDEENDAPQEQFKEKINPFFDGKVQYKQSLSIFQKQRLASMRQYTFENLSSIYNIAPQKKLIRDQMKEMELIKRKLADKKYRVSIKVLNRGIITPVILDSERQSLLPAPGRSVHKDFPKEKKKKGKKGKKKKRK